ncbi:MAG: MFS transporter [Propionibacteriaceae bacterium]
MEALGGLLLPVTVMPCMMVLGLLLLAAKFHPQHQHTLVEKPRQISFRDPRVLPFLIAGFLLFLTFSGIQTILGFAIQDRLALSDSATAGTTAALMVLMAVAMALTQGVLVRRLGWDARKLLRTGLPLMALAAVLFIPHGSLITLALGSLLLGIGSGLAIPGYSAGPTMAVDHDEQGGLAGLTNATNGLTYVITPVLSTTLYGFKPVVAFITFAVLITVGSLFVFIHPALKPAPSQS